MIYYKKIFNILIYFINIPKRKVYNISNNKSKFNYKIIKIENKKTNQK